MNYCLIDRQRCYPAVGSSIKITYENPMLKDRDAQTMEIEFPLSIVQNRKVFGAVNRLDVSKTAKTFTSCQLYADDLLVISGKGTITSYTDTSVKLQIKSGINVSEYSEYTDIYIDELEYDTIYDTEFGGFFNENGDENADNLDYDYGVPIYSLHPVYDETNAVIFNAYATRAWKEASSFKPFYPRTPQVNLSYLVHAVLERMGYKLRNSTLFNATPWKDLYILSLTPSTTIAGALPHWSVKTFLQQLRRLFNICFVFDAAAKTADVMNGTDSLETVSYQPADEFSTDYDEEGIEYYEASNLKYSLGDSEYWENPDIEEEKLDAITVKEYTDRAAVVADTSLSDMERQTCLFHLTGEDYNASEQALFRYAYYKYDSDSETYKLTGAAGAFQHLTRTAGSDNELELLIAPACVAYDEFTGPNNKTTGWLPVGTSELETAYHYWDTETERTYVTMEEILEDDASTTKDEAERMELFFIDESQYHTLLIDYDNGLTSANWVTSWEVPYTTVGHPQAQAIGSFELAETPIGNQGNIVPSIGALHTKSKLIDNTIQVVIKFLCDGVPDPKKIYLFHGKRYLADKIELTVTDSGLQRLATGYFYEILE